MAIGTARMASLCLPGSELHVGVQWQGSDALARTLSDPSRPAVLLYPGPGAIDVLRDPPPRPVTLIVVDGTWWQAKKIVRANPLLAALPRYAFTAPTPSEYRIRREPRDDYVSTLEALVHVLGALEGDPARFLPLLVPFRAMIDAQIACRQQRMAPRSTRRSGPRRPRVPPWMAEREGDLVCVVAEANAWPYRSAGLAAAHPDELVHWVAHRLATGETFERVVAPRNPLAPATPSNVGLDEGLLAGGCSVPELLAGWQGFVRASDVVCSWGKHTLVLFERLGAPLPEARLDLRAIANLVVSGRSGMPHEFLARIGAPEVPRLAAGRGGARLGQIVDITGRFVREARTSSQRG